MSALKLPKVKFKESAFKHGLSKGEILFALENTLKSKSKHSKRWDACNSWAICVLPDGNSCEIVFYYEDVETIVVFHAMSPARKSFVSEVERKGQ